MIADMCKKFYFGCIVAGRVLRLQGEHPVLVRIAAFRGVKVVRLRVSMLTCIKAE